ncbi:hypothetical protein EPUS_06260 [Endocarpon pusillum Z07020]|uniref:Zn(2)-C6 fungal-type domain-containing protein n=1 Tax=Endocarpon pusillum (strain Z07020 / HMAS-L-300199) TaxID=1263415 RepID=U1GAT3_ENDPU|nr:uncharacterized protein EPUS_06260 [Endocarpon pusillum Z07020]ERF68816.1 hypothetical protein EPUS_06260 [Endocarpon pusillum Z07020]
MRICGNKVRTGCWTCKARHLKCGEEKPQCNRCVTAGRVCDGYSTSRPAFKPAAKCPKKGLIMIHYTANLPTRNIAKTNIPKAPSTAISQDSREQRFFEYFKTRTVLDLVSGFNSELWSLYVLQLAHKEPAVRHIVIGIGCLHKQFESAATGDIFDSRFALKQYSTAIKHVIGSFNPGSQQSIDVALLTCALFALFESLQGHYRSALTHITSGLKVLQERQANNSSSPSSYKLARFLEDLFNRLGPQVLEVADIQSMRETCLQDITVPSTFSSIEEAEVILTSIWHRIHYIMLYLEASTSAGFLPLLDPGKQELLGTMLARFFGRWSAAFDEYLANKLRSKLSCGGSPKIQMEPGLYILRMWRELIKVWQGLDASAGETAWDPFIDQFKLIADLATSFVDQSAKTTAYYSTPMTSTLRDAPRPHTLLGGSKSTAALTDLFGLSGHIQSNRSNVPHAPVPAPNIKPTLSLSTGIIMPLYVVASRCRDPAIRRQVIRVLSICNRREGIWDSQFSSQVARQILEIEEAGARQYLREAGKQNANDDGKPIIIKSMEQIPECVRVRTSWTSFGPDKQATVQYKKSNAGNKQLESQEHVYEGHFQW